MKRRSRRIGTAKARRVRRLQWQATPEEKEEMFERWNRIRK